MTRVFLTPLDVLRQGADMLHRWEPLVDFVVECTEHIHAQLRNCIDTIDTITAGEVSFILSEGILMCCRRRRPDRSVLVVVIVTVVFVVIAAATGSVVISIRSFDDLTIEIGDYYSLGRKRYSITCWKALPPRTEKHHSSEEWRTGVALPRMLNVENCNIRCFEGFIRSRC